MPPTPTSILDHVPFPTAVANEVREELHGVITAADVARKVVRTVDGRPTARRSTPALLSFLREAVDPETAEEARRIAGDLAAVADFDPDAPVSAVAEWARGRLLRTADQPLAYTPAAARDAALGEAARARAVELTDAGITPLIVAITLQAEADRAVAAVQGWAGFSVIDLVHAAGMLQAPAR